MKVEIEASEIIRMAKTQTDIIRLDIDDWTKNYVLNRFEITNRCTVLQSKPLRTVIPVTDKCNTRCSMCCKLAPNSKLSSLSFIELQRYLKDILPTLRTIGFEGNGEPLFAEDFFSMFEWVMSRMDKRATSYLITNGHLISREFIISLFKYRLKSLSISLNASTEETRFKIMKLKDIKRVIDCISFIILMKQKYKFSYPWINISMVVTRHNIKEMLDFIELGNKLHVDRIEFKPLLNTIFGQDPWSIRYRDLFIGNDKNTIEILDEVEKATKCSKVPVLYQRDKFLNQPGIEPFSTLKAEYSKTKDKPDCIQEGIESKRRKGSLLCVRPWIDYHCYHISRKYIWPCCYLPGCFGPRSNPFGSFDKKDFKEIWNGEGYVKLRKQINSGKLSKYCLQCPMDSEEA